MQVSLAPPDFSEWPELMALVRQSFAYMDERINPPSSLKGMSLEDFKAKAQAESLIVARAEPQARLLGCAFAALREDCLYLGKVAVAPEARGQGVARAMFAVAEALAREQGRPFLELQTRVELTENHATFAALGFQVVARTAHPGFDRPTSLTLRKRVAAAALA